MRVVRQGALAAAVVCVLALGAPAAVQMTGAGRGGVGSAFDVVAAWAQGPMRVNDGSHVRCRNSRSHSPGTWTDGRLVNGALLPRKGVGFVTWSFRKRKLLNPSRYRWGTCRVVKLVIDVAADFRGDHPFAPRLLIGDLSRQGGGPLSGHASHQRGLDVDVYYPRRDGREAEPRRVDQIDRELARELVTRFLRAGAHRIYVGPSTGLDRPGDRVDPWPNHDNHLHARFRPRASDKP